jgi:hypothetical protein
MKNLTQNEKIISMLLVVFGVLLIAQGLSFEMPSVARRDVPSSRELFVGFGSLCIFGTYIFISSINAERK